MEGDPEKVESRGLSFSVTPDLKNGSRWANIFTDLPFCFLWRGSLHPLGCEAVVN
jgi:hypothetical protein